MTRQPNRWGRIIAAGVLTELSIVVVIGVTIGIYRASSSPTDAELQAFANQVGTYVAVFGVGIAAFCFARWATRMLPTNLVRSGLIVGLIAALLHAGMVAGMMAGGQPFLVAYVVADVMKLVGGALGGYGVQ